MSNELNALAERVANLEKVVALLQAQLRSKSGHWLDRLRRSVTDAQAFDEAMRLGREFRQSCRDATQTNAQP